MSLPSPGGAEEGPDASPSRVSRTFTERSLRHYQTLGCIDPPQKQGRIAKYGYLHFLQALLVRKLLWQRLSSEQIAALLVGRPTEKLERMLLGGVELVPRTEPDDGQADTLRPGSLEAWSRVRIAPGLELHLNADLPRLKPAELRRLTELLEMALRKHRA